MNLKITVLALTISFVLIGCASTLSNPYAKQEKLANTITDKGGIAVQGLGIGTRRDVALEKARINGRASLALAFEAKTEVLRKRFLEEVGASESSELNEHFSAVTKITAKKTLIASKERSTLYSKKDRKTGKMECSVVMYIDPMMFGQSLLDEMKKKEVLYQRFIASKSYEELKKEMDSYEE